MSLTKIGGYVVNGQPSVSHDGTLTGAGTPDSPLGVNETVLYEGTFAEGGGTTTLSESVDNFRWISICYTQEASSETFAGTFTQLIDMEGFRKSNGSYICLIGGFAIANEFGIRMSQINLNGTTISATLEGQIYKGTQSVVPNLLHIYRVVGIGRISGGN